MKNKLTIKATATTLCVAWLLAGCATSQVWYQPGKTPAQAHAAYVAAESKALHTMDPHGLGMTPGQNAKKNQLTRSSMAAEGYQLVPAKTVPDAKQYPKP